MLGPSGNDNMITRLCRLKAMIAVVVLLISSTFLRSEKVSAYPESYPPFPPSKPTQRLTTVEQEALVHQSTTRWQQISLTTKPARAHED